MGFNHSSSSSSSSSSFSSSTSYALSSDSKIRKNELLGAVLAGFGIWTKPSPMTKPQPTTQTALTNVYPLRVVRVKDVNPQMTGRMVISGRMADVCAELDRLAA